MKDNITLIGMPGVGKSSMGVVLAKVLGYEFLDSDLVIQKQENSLLKDLIEKYGNDGFLKIENRVNAALDVSKTVIATGGSVIYGEEAMYHLKKISNVIYLKADYETISHRVSNLVGRGVAIQEGQTLFDLYQERAPLYMRYADIIVDMCGLSIEESVKAVLEGLEELSIK